MLICMATSTSKPKENISGDEQNQMKLWLSHINLTSTSLKNRSVFDPAMEQSTSFEL